MDRMFLKMCHFSKENDIEIEVVVKPNCMELCMSRGDIRIYRTLYDYKMIGRYIVEKVLNEMLEEVNRYDGVID